MPYVLCHMLRLCSLRYARVAARRSHPEVSGSCLWDEGLLKIRRPQKIWRAITITITNYYYYCYYYCYCYCYYYYYYCYHYYYYYYTILYTRAPRNMASPSLDVEGWDGMV